MKPFAVDISEGVELDMLGEVRAGFPSLADEEPTEKLDLVKLLVRHPSSTFFFRIGGTSMVDAEMDEGDIVIVDRSIEPYNGCSAVCFIDGEFTLKRIQRHKDYIELIAANPNFKPIRIDANSNFVVWGVVTYVIKKA